MSDPTARTFSSDFRRFFVRGLVILLPSVLTLWIVVKAYQFVDSAIAEPINGGVRLMMASAAPWWEPIREAFDPSPDQLATAKTIPAFRGLGDEVMIPRLRAENIATWWADRWYMDLIGLVIAILAVYVAGHLLGGFLGKALYKRLERLITTLPIFKQVYPYVKQIVDFLFSDDKAIKFKRVVIMEYPRKGIWSLGFQTGGNLRAIEAKAGDAVTIFVPSSPTPFTGYTVTVPSDDVFDLPITVEEAIRFIVSGGVLIPEHQLIPARELRPAPAEALSSLSLDGINPGERTDKAIIHPPPVVQTKTPMP